MSKMGTRKRLIQELDKETSRIVRKRDGACVLCHKRESLQCGHLITRSKYSVRWDLGNCFCQCSGCNLRHEHQPEHFTNWFIQKFGADAYSDLVARSNKIHKWTEWDLKVLLDERKAL